VRTAAEVPWTGHLTFPVYTEAGHPLGDAEIKVWVGQLDVWFRDHCLAVLDRDELRTWLAGDRTGPLAWHDITLLFVEGRLAIRLGSDQLPHRLPTDVAARLARL
jgi:hypothetical protein